MNKNESNRKPTQKRKLSFLLPALLTGILVFEMLPQTQVALREIPDRLSLIEEVAAETPEPDPVKPENPIKVREEETPEEEPQAEGHFTDGVFTGSSRGYGGLITVQVTVEEGQITDIAILSAPGETDPYFSLAQSILDQIKLKQSWELDAVSGATYSSKGILGAVQNAMTGETVENAAPPKTEPQGTKVQESYKDPDAYKDGTYYGSAPGFGGTIRVKVVVRKGKIYSVTVMDAPGETSSYLNRAKAVTGSIVKKNSPNVDAVSGATYSSTGIINAVKRALRKASADGSKNDDLKESKVKNKNKKKTKTKQKTKKATKKQDTYEDPAAYEDGTYYGEADGFGGLIKVKVIIKKGKIKKITITKADGETEEFLAKAKSVISKIIKKGSPNVDTVSGATYSSTGIINAVKRALKKAAKTKNPDLEEETPQEKKQPAKTDTTKDSSSDSSGEEEEIPSDAQLKDGVYTGTGEGFGGDIVVQVTIKDGKISDVTLVSAEDETPAYFNKAKVLLETVKNEQTADVDTVTGATYSSKGILSAVKNALSKAVVSTSPDEEEESGENTGGDTEDPDSGNTDDTGDSGDAGDGGDSGSTDDSGESGSTGDGGDSGEHTGGGASGGEESEDYYYADGTWSRTGWCVDSANDVNYEVTVTVTVTDHVIQTVNVSFGEDESDDPEANDWYISRALNGTSKIKGIPKQIVTAQSADVDVVSGATYTSNTMISLAASILSDIRTVKPADEEEKEEEEEKKEEEKKEEEEKQEEQKDEEKDKEQSEGTGDDKGSDQNDADTGTNQSVSNLPSGAVSELNSQKKDAKSSDGKNDAKEAGSMDVTGDTGSAPSSDEGSASGSTSSSQAAGSSEEKTEDPGKAADPSSAGDEQKNSERGTDASGAAASEADDEETSKEQTDTEKTDDKAASGKAADEKKEEDKAYAKEG